MRRLLIVTAAAAMLAGCSVTATDITARIKQVQDYTALACSFVPTAAVLIAIFDRDKGASVLEIGSAICAAVVINPKAEGPGRYVPKVRGVPVRGKFI